ncbi:MAG: hypothetical protein DRN99_01305 [Thermoproteota archaeon]|nr:MAG: hypothetical protein DRN99_01305 [Candidatus Korarchaeota archaeon]
MIQMSEVDKSLEHIEKLLEEKRALTKEMEKARNMRDQFNMKVKERAEKRRQLIDELRKLDNQLKQLISKRQELSKEIEELNKKKEEAFNRYKEGIEEARRLKQQYNEIISEIDGNPSQILFKIRELERNINEGRVPLEREHEVVMRISKLEQDYRKYKKALETKRMAELRYIEASKWRTLAMTLKENIAKLREEKAAIREEIGKIVKEKDKKREEIERISREISEIKGESDKYHQTYLEYKKKIGEITAKIRSIIEGVEKEREEEEKKISRKLVDEIMEKVRKKEKLEYWEFCLLVREGRI